MPRDGNCLAHCLGNGLTYIKQDEKKRPARLIRAELHAYMARKTDEFAAFWDGRNTSDKEGELLNFAAYLKEMALDGKYLGHLELAAASRAFDLTLVVIQVKAQDPPTRHGSGSRMLALWYHGDHYDLLLPENRDAGYPAVITGVTAFGDTTGGRGGGGSEDEADAITVYTAATGGGRKARVHSVKPGSRDGARSEASKVTIFTMWGGRGRLPGTAGSAGESGDQHLAGNEAGNSAMAQRAQSETVETAGKQQAEVDVDSAAPRSKRARNEDAENEGGDNVNEAATGVTQETLLEADIDVGEVPEPPAAVTRKRTNTNYRSKVGAVVRSSWTCPECQWVAEGANWGRLKAEHIRKNHTDLADHIGKHDRRAIMVPWSPACAWRCPIEGCDMGMKDDGACAQYRHTIRINHWKEFHPLEAKEKFFLDGVGGKNAAKASVACRNRGAAARVQGLNVARDGGHDPVWLSYPIPPPAGERKKAWHEDLKHRLFCKSCNHLTAKAEEMAARDCVPGVLQPKVHQMVRRLKARLEDDDVRDEVRAAATHTVEILEGAFQTDAKAKSHTVEAVAWPGDTWTLRFFCIGCGMTNDTGNFKGACNPRAHRRPTSTVTTLREIAAEDCGPRPRRAARRILDLMGTRMRLATRGMSGDCWLTGWDKGLHDGGQSSSGGNSQCQIVDGQGGGSGFAGYNLWCQRVGATGDHAGFGFGEGNFGSFQGGWLGISSRSLRSQR